MEAKKVVVSLPGFIMRYMTLTRTWNILQCTGTDRECEAQESLVLVGQHVSEALGQALAESRQLYDAAVLDLCAVSELAKLVLAVLSRR